MIAGLFALSTVCELLFAHLDRSLICMSILLSASVWHIYPGQEALYIILCTFLPSTVSISIHCLNNANECSMHGLILFATLLVVSCAWALLSSRQAEELMRDTKEAKKELRSNVSSGSQTDQQPGSSNDIRVPLSIPFKQPSSLGGKLAPVSEDRETLNLDNIKEDSPNTKPVQSSRKPPDRDKSMSLVSLIQKFPRPRSGHGSGRNSRDRNSKDRLKPPTSPFSSFANKIAKRSGSQGGLLNPCPTSSAFSSLTFHKTHKLIRKTSNDSENRKSMDHHQSCGLLFLSEKSATGSNPGAFRFFTSQDRPPGQLSEAGTFSSFNSFRAWATNPLPGSSDGYPSESLDASKKDKSDDLTTLLFSTNKSSSGAVPSPDASSQLLRAMSSRDSVDSIEELEKALSIRRAMDQAGGGTRIGRAGSQGRLGQMQKESVGADRPFVFAPAFPTAGRPPLVPNSSSFLDLGRRGSNSPMLDTVLEETSANDPSLLLSQNSSELLSINLDNIKSSRPVSKSGSNTASTQQLDKILESGQSFASSIYMYCGKDENASQYSGSSALPQNLRQGAASYWTGISQQSKPTPNGGVLDELEESILNHRRQLDEKCALLEEISIDKILGFGSMGMVYFAKMWDHQGERERERFKPYSYLTSAPVPFLVAAVVVKLIEHGTGLLGKEQNRGRLARVEAAVSRMLIHPNVVVTYDCCTGPMDTQRLSAATPISRGAGRSNKPKVMTVMVQEFCEGGTLRDAINKQAFGLERSSPDYNDRALRVALDIANGMRYLSMLRILHLDLKAENILLQKMPVQGNRGEAGKMTGGYVAKVADFGEVFWYFLMLLTFTHFSDLLFFHLNKRSCTGPPFWLRFLHQWHPRYCESYATRSYGSGSFLLIRY